MAGVFKAVTFMVLVFAAVVVFAENHNVGDDMKWRRPRGIDFYSNWAADKVFHVGDELEFEFDDMRHDVAIVTKEIYESCNKEPPIKVMTTSPTKIKLDTTGPQYFICTILDHCRLGQKLEINVVAAEGSATQAPEAAPSVGGSTTEASGAGPTAEL